MENKEWYAATCIIVISCVLGLTARSIDGIITNSTQSSEDFDEKDRFVRVQMDMVFTMKQWNLLQRLINNVSDSLHTAMLNSDLLPVWSNKEIPYKIARGDFSTYEKVKIQAAMRDWETYTCIKFRKSQKDDNNWIRLQNGTGCLSVVGMAGGLQTLELAPECRVKGVITHELGHTIGFHHEQTRPDRDSYVTIVRENIPPNMYYNFEKYTWSTMRGYELPYDYRSIMHYGKTAFSFNGQPTILTKDPRYQNVIGNRKAPSYRDIKMVNVMYECDENCPSVSCPPNGFLGKDCRCYCPGDPVMLCPSKGGVDIGGTGADDGCVDKYVDCGDWAASGGCTENSRYMLVNCKKSCTVCKTSGSGDDVVNVGVTNIGSGISSQTGSSTGNNVRNFVCQDRNIRCREWMNNGECDKHAEYMHSYCQKSCDTCPSSERRGLGAKATSSTACIDLHTQCSHWARGGHCRGPNSSFMTSNCKRSCNMCGLKHLSCSDLNDNCIYWATVGYCVSYDSYMRLHCRQSCSFC